MTTKKVDFRSSRKESLRYLRDCKEEVKRHNVGDASIVVALNGFTKWREKTEKLYRVKFKDDSVNKQMDIIEDCFDGCARAYRALHSAQSRSSTEAYLAKLKENISLAEAAFQRACNVVLNINMTIVNRTRGLLYWEVKSGRVDRKRMIFDQYRNDVLAGTAKYKDENNVEQIVLLPIEVRKHPARNFNKMWDEVHDNYYIKGWVAKISAVCPEPGVQVTSMTIRVDQQRERREAAKKKSAVEQTTAVAEKEENHSLAYIDSEKKAEDVLINWFQRLIAARSERSSDYFKLENEFDLVKKIILEHRSDLWGLVNNAQNCYNHWSDLLQRYRDHFDPNEYAQHPDSVPYDRVLDAKEDILKVFDPDRNDHDHGQRNEELTALLGNKKPEALPKRDVKSRNALSPILEPPASKDRPSVSFALTSTPFRTPARKTAMSILPAKSPALEKANLLISARKSSQKSQREVDRCQSEHEDAIEEARQAAAREREASARETQAAERETQACARERKLAEQKIELKKQKAKEKTETKLQTDQEQGVMMGLYDSAFPEEKPIIAEMMNSAFFDGVVDDVDVKAEVKEQDSLAANTDPIKQAQAGFHTPKNALSNS